MSILSLSGIALLAAMLILILRELRPAFAPPVRLGASVIIIGAALLLYAPVIARIRTLFGETGAGEYMDTVLRALGIALICELTALFCRDLGENTLAECGAVSEAVALQMAEGARNVLQADIALSVTGLAGPSGDEYGNPVGTVFIGYCDEKKAYAKKFLFSGDREAVRTQAINAALEIVLSEL